MTMQRGNGTVPWTLGGLWLLVGAITVGCEHSDQSPEGVSQITQAAQARVVLCHRGETLSVAQPAVAAHLRHGDTLGACPVEDAGVDAGAAADGGAVQ